MGRQTKAQELRAYLALAMKLREIVHNSCPEDAELFLAAAEAMESRAHRRASELDDEQHSLDMLC